MPDKKRHLDIPLTGKYMTRDPATIGQNFQTLKNLRYTDTHLKGVGGMTKITSSIINSTYFKTRNAFHFKKSQPAESHLLVQAYNTGLTGSVVLDNTTAIPSAGNFGSALWSDSASAGRGYFSNAPDGQMIYCNGVETCIWGGNETRCGAVILSGTALSALSDTLTSPYDCTDLLNKSSGSGTTVSSASYGTILIGTTRKMTGAKFYVSTANTTSNTLTVKENDGSAWTALTVSSDGTSSGGATFAQTGTISWAASSAKPAYLEGYYLYWYEFTISAGSAVIYHICPSMSFQAIVDMWDGVYRVPLRFYVYTSSQADKTTNVMEDDYEASTTSTYADVSSLVATTQYLEVGFGDKQTGLSFELPADYMNGSVSVASQGTITMSGIPVANEEFVIDTQTFIFKAARTTTGEVTIGSDAAETAQLIEFAVNTDLTTVTAERSDETVIITAVTAGTVGDAIVFTETATNMEVDGSGTLGATTAGSDAAACTMSIDYWTGAAYATVGTIIDGTSTSSVSFAKSGVVTWNNANVASEVKKQYDNAVPLYYYRVKWSSALDSSVRINVVGGIQASVDVSYYKFPVYAQGRVLLCADMVGDKNKFRCSSQWMPQVYNGADSVDVYYGDEGELTCGTELFSQFGSNLYSLILMFKDTETWVTAGQDITVWGQNTFLLSNTIGCPAPLTLKTVNLAAEPGTGINRALALWQGSNGIYMSDGRAPIPIHGDIEEYFDTTDPRCITSSLIGDSVGWIDPVKMEYHWIFASGTSATSLNTELVYDIKRNRWFPIDRVSDLQCGVLVTDTYGNSYNYGFLDTGYMERLEYGTDFDGEDIVHEFKFGDFLPTNSVMTETMIDEVKLVTVAKTTTANTITVTHYGDGKTSGTTLKTYSPADSGHRIAQPSTTNSLGGYTFHSLDFSMTTDNEAIGFEPLVVGIAYHVMR